MDMHSCLTRNEPLGLPGQCAQTPIVIGYRDSLFDMIVTSRGGLPMVVPRACEYE